jgi:hypothetical protein
VVKENSENLGEHLTTKSMLNKVSSMFPNMDGGLSCLFLAIQDHCTEAAVTIVSAEKRILRYLLVYFIRKIHYNVIQNLFIC